MKKDSGQGTTREIVPDKSINKCIRKESKCWFSKKKHNKIDKMSMRVIK